MFTRRKWNVTWMAVALMLFAVGCKKKVPAPPPPPAPATAPEPTPPSAAAPTITQFTAEPGTIQRGQGTTLRWAVTGQTTNIFISIGESLMLGSLRATGNQQMFPLGSTTYTLTAVGPGGVTTADATVTMTAPPPRPAAAPTPAPAPAPPTISLSERLSEVQDAYFDYDQSGIRPDARDTLTKDASVLMSILRDFPNAAIIIEGNCDERGSAEYNIGLGDRRASAAKDFLIQLGVSGDRLRTISYGKERPACTEHDESCWQRNRHDHFAPGQ